MAETSGLLNRRRGITPTEGSNPSVSASAFDAPKTQETNALSGERACPMYLSVQPDAYPRELAAMIRMKKAARRALKLKPSEGRA